MDGRNSGLSGELTQSGLQRWKDLRTRIMVVHKFGNAYSSKKTQLTIQNPIEKSKVLAKKQPAGWSLTSESPLSPQRCLAQNECNQKPSVPCLEHLGSFLKKHSGSKDALVLSLLAYFSLQFLPKDSLDESTARMVICTVVVVVLTSRMEGAAAIELVRLIIQIASKIPLIWLFMLFGGLVTGSSAESSVQTCVASKDASNTLEAPFDIKVVAVTICLGCFTIVVARKILTYLTRPEPVPVRHEYDVMGGLERTDNRKSNPTLNIYPQV